MKTEAEIRAAFKLMVEFADTGGTVNISRESFIQFTGIITAFGWVLNEEVMPDEPCIIPAVLKQMKKHLQELQSRNN